MYRFKCKLNRKIRVYFLCECNIMQKPLTLGGAYHKRVLMIGQLASKLTLNKVDRSLKNQTIFSPFFHVFARFAITMICHATFLYFKFCTNFPQVYHRSFDYQQVLFPLSLYAEFQTVRKPVR